VGQRRKILGAAGALALAPVLALALSGCLDDDAGAGPGPGAFTAHSAPPPQPSVGQTIAPGMVVASGDLQGVEGAARGHIEISVVTPDRYAVKVTDFATDAAWDPGATLPGRNAPLTDGSASPAPTPGTPWTEVRLCDRSLADYTSSGSCGLARPLASLQQGEGTLELSLTEVSQAPLGGDPSFLRSLILVEHRSADARVVGGAELSWRHPDARPTLRVKDSGPASGANGQVQLDGSGAPLSYTTASGDSWPSIAERFGITEDDLLWLNPVRSSPSYTGENAYAGEVLNLSKAGR